MGKSARKSVPDDDDDDDSRKLFDSAFRRLRTWRTWTISPLDDAEYIARVYRCVRFISPLMRRYLNYISRGWRRLRDISLVEMYRASLSSRYRRDPSASEAPKRARDSDQRDEILKNTARERASFNYCSLPGSGRRASSRQRRVISDGTPRAPRADARRIGQIADRALGNISPHHAGWMVHARFAACFIQALEN